MTRKWDLLLVPFRGPFSINFEWWCLRRAHQRGIGQEHNPGRAMVTITPFLSHTWTRVNPGTATVCHSSVMEAIPTGIHAGTAGSTQQEKTNRSKGTKIKFKK